MTVVLLRRFVEEVESMGLDSIDVIANALSGKSIPHSLWRLGLCLQRDSPTDYLWCVH
jgi:hypothetical protein